MPEIANGKIKYWTIPNNGSDFFEKYIKNYLEYTKEYSSSKLWEIAPITLLKGSNYNGTTYKSSSTTSAHFLIADGMIITFNIMYQLHSIYNYKIIP